MADASGISDIKSLEEGRPSSFVGRNKKAIIVVVATIVVLAVVAGTAAGVTASKRNNDNSSNSIPSSPSPSSPAPAPGPDGTPPGGVSPSNGMPPSSFAPPPGSNRSTSSTANPAVSAMLTRISAIRGTVQSFWLTHGLDTQYGAFHGSIDRQGSPGAGTGKGLVQQARHLYGMCQLYSTDPTAAPAEALASKLYSFITTYMLDPSDNTFFDLVSRNGSKPASSSKSLNANSYAMYALAVYGRQCGVPAASAAALAAWKSWDVSSWKGGSIGYDDTVKSTSVADTSNGACRGSLDTNLHAAEALAEIYLATKDPSAAQRLGDMLQLLAGAVVPGQGFIPPCMSDIKNQSTYQASGAATVLNYGHNIEASWLLQHVMQETGIVTTGAAAMTTAFKSLATSNLPRATENTTGASVFMMGTTAPGSATDRTSQWWVPIESALAMWAQYEASCDNTTLVALNKTLNWIESRHLDQQYGEMYWQVEVPSGQPTTTWSDGSGYTFAPTVKGTLWKASYHTVRFTTYLQGWMGDWVKQPGAACGRS